MGEEVEFAYTASFLLGENEDADTAAHTHSDYLMGVLKSEKLVRSFGINYTKSEGLAAPRLPLKLTGIRSRQLSDGSTEVSYKYRTKMLVHKTAARKMLRDGSFELVLPYDLSQIYEKRCTDTHYDSFGDYWYFWDPYRRGCERLLREPATRKITVNVKALEYASLENNTRFDLLRGNNGNGKLLQIDLITGFDESDTRNDIGWKIFRNLNESLISKFGFEQTGSSGSARAPMRTFEKDLEGGAHVVIRHLLVDTAVESRSRAFARFMKDSVREADVIVYSGHSGLGGNLDIPSLEAKAGGFEFARNKRQVFFFSSCSSYSYYLEHFKAEKTRAKIDVLSNGLAAYMDEDSLELQAFLRSVLDEEQVPDWMDVLKKMEAAIPYDMTYLLNVGGV